ncbi:MAG: peptidoglycan DD-metalloendopeptidase family protein [Campylobacterota bacterium]|nr:peptidoglycan DD-metalloendopeptidase family protein [Campylobacterota bacterium]
MIRFTLALLLAVSLFGKTDIDQQITTTSKKINTFDKEHSTLHKKMAKNAKAILKEKNAILKQQKFLQELMQELSIKEEDYKQNKEELVQLKSSQKTLDEEQKKIEQELVFALARNVSLSMLLDDERVINADAMITEEVLKKLTEASKKEISSLNSQFSDNSDRIGKLQERTAMLKNAITEMESKQKELLTTQDANKKALKKLKKNKKSYKHSVDTLLSQQGALQKTLSQLNIIKKDRIQKEKERIARQKAEAKAKAEARKRAEAAKKGRTVVASKNLPKVKKVGSSYANTKTKKYRGRKTIAPLDGYKLVKKFGPYTDPIYNLKIFNESVSLKPTTNNAKVKNVLNGKVILAQNTALLENVVIIEHSNGIHTIYAHMDKIAPTIKKGKKLKKGSVIGRVSNELMFEVTQKNYHINPMQLIR